MSFENDVLGILTKNSQKVTLSTIPLQTAEYFHLKTNDKQEYLVHRLQSLQESFLTLCEVKNFEQITHCSASTFHTYGVISAPTGEKITNEAYLFNLLDGSNCPVKLNLSMLHSYSLFNGQIVAIAGTNPQGNELFVERFFYSNGIKCNMKSLRRPMSIEVAKGPFSIEKLKIIFSTSVGLYVLMGPFVGTKDNEYSVFKEFTDAVHKELTKFQNAKVFLIPSLECANAVNVFPQPQIVLEEQYKNIQSLPNPCYFSVNDCTVSICNFDNLIDIAADEINKVELETSDESFITDRNTRMVNSLIFQQTFVPSLNSLSNVSYGKWLDMPFVPDLYVISSKIKIVHKAVGPCTVLNISNNQNYHIVGDTKGKFDLKMN